MSGSKEDVYIEAGTILRGKEATGKIAQKDAEELMKETGLKRILNKVKPKLNEDKTGHKSAKSEAEEKEPEFIDVKLRKNAHSRDYDNEKSHGKVEVQGASVKVAGTRDWIEAKGLSSSYRNVKVVGASILGKGIGVNADVKGIDSEIATLEAKALQVRAKAGLNVEVRGVAAKVGTVKVSRLDGNVDVSANVELITGLDATLASADVSGVKATGKATATASGTVAEINMAKADISVIKGTAQAQLAMVSAKGIEGNIGTADVSGVKATAKAAATVTVKGAEVNIAKADMTGYKATAQAQAMASAKGFEGNIATAEITGTETKVETMKTGKAVGKEFRVANYEATGLKTGAQASATVQARGSHLRVANVQTTGIDATASATASASVAGFEGNIGNVQASGYGGIGVSANAEIKPGIDAGNVNIGTHTKTGINFSTKVGIGNVDLSLGPPSLNIAPSLGLSLGGGGGGGDGGKGGNKEKGENRGSGSRGDRGKQGDSHGCMYTSQATGSDQDYNSGTGSISGATGSATGTTSGAKGNINGSTSGATGSGTGGTIGATGSGTGGTSGATGSGTSGLLTTGHGGGSGKKGIVIGGNGIDEASGSGISKMTGSGTGAGKAKSMYSGTTQGQPNAADEEPVSLNRDGLRRRHTGKGHSGFGGTSRRQYEQPAEEESPSQESEYIRALKEYANNIGEMPLEKEKPVEVRDHPKTREEAKKLLRKYMEHKKEHLEKEQCDSKGEDGAVGGGWNGDEGAKGVKQGGGKGASASEEIEEQAPKKPFGDNKNIYTLDTIAPRSTKKTGAISKGGKIHGFKPD